LIEKNKIQDEIIQIAGNIFSKLGYKKTTMDNIAKEVNKGKSSIYYYFNSKEEIFKAVVLLEAKTFRKIIINAISKSNDPGDKLKQYVITRMQTVNTFTNFHTSLNNEYLGELNFVKKLKKIYAKEEIRLFNNILKEGVEKNFFQINDIELAATAIVMAMKGLEKMLLHNESEYFEQKLKDIINVIFYGIVKR
jgi:AcrR family transcriptional regulator